MRRLVPLVDITNGAVWVDPERVKSVSRSTIDGPYTRIKLKSRRIVIVIGSPVGVLLALATGGLA